MSTVSAASVRCLLAVAVVCSGCSGSRDEQVFTSEDRALFRSMALNPVMTPPVDVGNDLVRARAIGSPEFRAGLASLGQQLFFDDRLSATGTKVACVDCHLPSHAFSDGRGDNQVSAGLSWTARNSPSLVNVGYYIWFGWAGGADSLWAQGKFAYEGKATMKGDKLLLLQQVARHYGDRFQQVFGSTLPRELLTDEPNRFTVTPRDPMTDDQLELLYQWVLKAWGAYLLQLNSGNAPFDRFARGDETALDPEQRRGLHLFIGKAGCISCHLGPNFTDNQFHSVGVKQEGAHVPAEDLGRFEGLQKYSDPSFAAYRLGPARAPTEADKGQFRTKSLRQVAQTGPYFHAGQAATLADVVWFYNQGGDQGGAGTPSPLMVPLGLSDEEQADLVAFLGALTGEPLDPNLTCNNARSPAAATTTTRCASIP